MSKVKLFLLFITVSFCLSACKTNTGTSVSRPCQTDINDNKYAADLELSISRHYADTEYSTSFDYIEVIDDKHNKLKNALADWQENDLNIDADIEMLDESLDYGIEPMYLGLDYTIEIDRMDETVLSLFVDQFINGGGAHPNTVYSSINFDVKTGEVLSIRDVITDYDEFKEAASEYIIDKLDNSVFSDGLFEDSRDLIRQFDEDTFDWTISQYGLNIYYETYTLGSYAMGPVHINLPYNEFEGYMKSEYFDIAGDCVCKVFNSYFEQATLLPLGNDLLEVNISSYYSDGYDTIYELSCGLDSTSLKGSYLCSEKLLFLDNVWYLAVTIDEASADYVTTLYRLEENQVTASDTIDAYYTHSTISAGKATMASDIYLMGTYTMERDYTIEDGKFIPENDLYTLVSTDYVSELTTTRELPVIINGEDVLLPVGSKVQMYQTDAESVVYLYVIDIGVVAELEIEKQDTEYFYEILIDGISENEYFERLPYAG